MFCCDLCDFGICSTTTLWSENFRVPVELQLSYLQTLQILAQDGRKAELTHGLMCCMFCDARLLTRVVASAYKHYWSVLLFQQQDISAHRTAAGFCLFVSLETLESVVCGKSSGDFWNLQTSPSRTNNHIPREQSLKLLTLAPCFMHCFAATGLADWINAGMCGGS